MAKLSSLVDKAKQKQRENAAKSSAIVGTAENKARAAEVQASLNAMSTKPSASTIAQSQLTAVDSMWNRGSQSSGTTVPTVGERISNTIAGGLLGSGAGFTNTLGSITEGLGNIGDKLQDKKEKRQAEQELEYIALYKQQLEDARKSGDKTAEKNAQIRLNQAEYRLKNISNLGDMYTEVNEAAVQDVYEKADELARKSQKKIEQAKQGTGAVGSALVDVGAAGTQLLGDIALGAVTGTGAMAPIFVRGFGSGAQQARQNGATYEQQLAYGLGSATVEALTEKIASVGSVATKAFGKGALDDITKGVIRAVEDQAKTAAGKQAINRLASIGTGFVGEGLEEAVSAMIDPLLQRATYSDEKIDWEQAAHDAAYQFLIGGVLGGVMGGIGGTDTRGVKTDKDTNVPIKPETKDTATVSPAASPEVQQIQAQAEVTKAQNPEAEVLGAATTLFTQQGMNLKTAQKRAEIVGKLIRGEEVSDKDLNRIEPTSKQTKAIFTQLTGVQFPSTATSIETLRDLYRSAHTVAQAAQAQVATVAENARVESQIPDEQILERAKEARAKTTPESDAKAAQILAQARGEIAPDGTALLSYKDFAARFKQAVPDATTQETARMYDQYLKENQTISFMGRRMTRQQVRNTLRSAPDGDKLTVAELDAMFDVELEAQSRDGKDATEHSVRNKEANNGRREESGQSPVQHDGQSGQPGERAGMAAAGLDQGAGSQEGAGSQGNGADARGHGEVSRGPVNPDAVSADGETNFMEIHEEAWSDEMRAQTQKFKRAGITLRSALGPIPIPGTTRACDGVSHLGVESIVQSDSPFFSFEQLCDHEVGHQYFFRDPALYQKCAREFRLRTSKSQRAELMKSYLGSYADVYAQKTAKEQAKIQAMITEEIICDAYAGMNRNGSNADQLQEFIKPIIDDWCVARDAELESAEKRYSIDSMAEAVGLTFEKDGQMTVFKDGSGNRVDEVTEKMVQTSPLGAVIQSAVDKKFITDTDAEKQITFFTELYNLMLKTQDIDLLWAVSSSIGFQPIEAGPRDPASLNQKSKFAGYTKNSDPQYSTTVDFTTICLKTQAVIDAMSATMMELGHGLTEDEIVNIVYRNTHKAGEPVPCPVCYVFSRWVGLGGLFDNMNNLQTQYANADLEVLRADIETLSQRIDEIMVKRGYALATGKGGSKSYVLPNSSTKKSFGDAKIVMEKELMARQLELQAKQNQDMVSGKKTMTKAEEAELAALKRDIQILDNWTWLTDVRLSENYAPVPPEILFDINAGKEFAERYPESWKFRTTRGPAMGKAATPYADEHLGQILRGAGASDLKKAELGDPAKNPFLKSKNGKLTPAAEKALQKSIAKIKAQNLLNGQRYQSTSDFRFEYALDYLLSFVEMQALGGKVQLYTKVAEAVRMFASIGAEVNCSLMPLGIGYRVNKDGSKTLIFSSVTGMNAEDAFNLSNEFDNVQPIMVGIGNEHIRLCMADDRITFIIPYHASGAGEARYVALMDIVGEHVEEREDYSNYQTDHKIEEPTKAQKAAYDLRLKLLTGKLGILSDADKQVLRDNEILHNLYKRFYGKDMDGNISDIDPKYLNPETRNSGKLFRDNECYGAFLTSEQAKNVMPFEYWDRTSTIDQADLNGQAFVEYCESLGLRPRFSGWGGNGVYHAEFDFSKESGYWKMLIDRSVYNRDGSYHEQQAINVTNFDAGFLLREKSVKGIVQPSLVNDPAKTEKIAQKSADQIREKRGEKKFSIFEKADPETVEASDILTRYSIREDDPPKNVIQNVYKAFYARDGKLYPPMVANLTEDEMKTALRGGVSGTMKSLDTPVGVWLDADIGKLATDADGNPLRNTKGRLAVVNEKGGGTLAFRPGWHLGEWPDAKQFNKDSSVYGPKSVMPDGLVFARCEIAADIDYQLDAMSLGMGENGKFNRTQAGLPMVPVDGYYKYRTNVDPNTAPWYITGAMRVVEILDDDDCAKICAEFGVKPSPRQSGKPINLADYGLKRGPVEPTKDVSAYKKTDAIRRNTEALKAALNAEGYENSYVSRPINFDDAEIRKEFDRNRQNPDEYREKAKNWAPLQVRDTSATKRYSVIDSSGRLLTEEQQEYFKDSKIVDSKGRLKVVYHGTTAEFNVFKRGDIGYHFGNKTTARTRVGRGKNAKLIESYLNITNPIEFDGDLGSWDADYRLAEELMERGIISQDEYRRTLVTDGGYRRTSGDANKVLREILLGKGYDGIAYSNTFESNGSTSYIIFNSNQAKLTSNTKPTADPDIRYSITPAFEQWYKETYGEDVSTAHLKRRLKTAERRAAEAEHDKKAAELKNTIDSEMDLTAWMIHHTKKMREQKRDMNTKLDEARKAKAEAVRTAVSETKVVERAKAEVQHDADRMAERRNAAKRLRVREDAYKQKVTEMKENQKLKRNAAKATLRDSKLAAKRRAEIEAEQGVVDTIRKNPAERAALEKELSLAEKLRVWGRDKYAKFVSQAASIERFGKRQTEGIRADTLVNIAGASLSTVETTFKNGLVDRAGNRIGDSMSDVFLCWDEKHKKVNEGQQALLQDFMLHWHNIDRMSIVARAESALETFELNHEWLRDMDPKEFARLTAMTEKELEKNGQYEAQQLAFQYHKLLRDYTEAANKPIFADDKGNSVTAETSQHIVDQYLEEHPWLLEKANGIYEWWDRFMREWAVGDTISEAEYERMHTMYPHYVPTYRADKNGVGGANFVGAGGANVSKAVKKAKGSHSEVMNIEDSFSNIVSKIIRLNRVNELYMNIIDTAMLDNDGLFSDMAYFDWDSSWQSGEYGKALLDGELTETVDDAVTAGLEDLGDGEFKLTGWLDGRKYTAFISKDLYKSIGNVTGYLESENEKLFIKAGNMLTGPMKSMITGYNPFFALRNLVRDYSTGCINSISGLAFPKYYARAWKEMAKGTDHWQTFKALGGTHATYYNNNSGFGDVMSQTDGVIGKTKNALGFVNNNTESATRFAEYLATIDRLGDTYENRLKGIKNSAEVTVDFSRKGSLGKGINAWVSYWNPAVQGIDKTIRSLIDSPDGSAIWKQASRTLGRAAMSTVLWEAVQYALLAYLDRDDEWEELDDRTKDTYYCIPLRKSKTFLKVPKNREWGAILGASFNRMLQWAGGREDPFENYIETCLEPNFLPPALLRLDEDGGLTSDVIGVSQALDLQSNKDFAGRTIVPYAYQQGTKKNAYDADTSVFSIALGQLIGKYLSPMQIDYIISDYCGDFGDLFIIATARSSWAGDGNAAEKLLKMVRSPFIADARYSNYDVNSYYELTEELGKVVQDKKNQLGNEKYKETIEYQTQKALDIMYSDQISELNRYVRDLPDGEEKDAVKAQIAQLAGDATEFYEDSMTGKVNNPIRTAEYHDFSETVSKELIRMDAFSGDYKFTPTGNPSSKYNDPDDEKNREYILTDEQKAYFKQLYREKYNEIFEDLIQSSKYKKKKDSEKAELLEDARDDVLDATTEEFFEWLDDTGVRSTKKQK